VSLKEIVTVDEDVTVSPAWLSIRSFEDVLLFSGGSFEVFINQIDYFPVKMQKCIFLHEPLVQSGSPILLLFVEACSSPYRLHRVCKEESSRFVRDFSSGICYDYT